MSHRRKRKPPQPPPDAAALLQAAADALTACRAAGLDVRVRHGAIECDEGLILGPLADGTYVARTRLYTEFPVMRGDDLD